MSYVYLSLILFDFLDFYWLNLFHTVIFFLTTWNMKGEFQNMNKMQWEVTTSLPDEIGVKVLFQFKTVSAVFPTRMRVVSRVRSCVSLLHRQCAGWCYNCPECGGWRWSVIKLWYQPSFILTSRPPQTDLIPRVIFIRWSLKDTVFISTTGEKPNKIL